MQLHPQQISPGENFDLFYFIRNHTDATTYYVQAKIYDVRTGAVLATQNLVQSPTNSRLFTATVQSPPDPQSIGRNIVSIATVYTDSGYTTKSTDYEEQEQYFLIRAELPFLAGGGGVDYRTVREIVQEEVDRGIKAIPSPPEPPEMPFDALFGAIGALTREINRVPKEAADDAALQEKLDEVLRAIGALPHDQVDLTPVINQLNALADAIERDRTENQQGSARLAGIIRSTAATIAKQITEEVTAAIGNHEFTLPSLTLSPGAPPQPVAAAPDISTLYAR